MEAGRYKVIVHYHQPNHVSFDSVVGVYAGTGSSSLPGQINFAYCPNLNGCRQAVKLSGTSNYIFERGDARLEFNIPEGKDTWIVSVHSGFTILLIL